MTTIDFDAPRFQVGTDHVESWFVRANDPASPRALWLKATVLTKADGTTLSQAWCSVFDGDRTEAFCQDASLAEAIFDGDATGRVIEVGPLRLGLNTAGGTSAGALGSEAGRVAWDLSFDRVAGRLGAPLCLLPSARLLDARFPKNKLVTPTPVSLFSGTFTWDGELWDLDGWIGMQGHNWGDAHSPEYAWGHCVFTDADTGAPVAVMEGASGRIELGGRVSPLLSMLVVRRGDEEYRFDRILDLWRQRPELAFPTWTLGMSGRHGKARLEMTGEPSRMVCLAYQNPARPTSYCLNSKTAAVRLAVVPANGDPFELYSAHGGALEFLTPHPNPAVAPIV